MCTRHLWIVVLVLLWPCLAVSDTTITYQGQLQGPSGPLTGQVDLQFELFDAETGGNSVAGPIPIAGVDVVDGLFQSELDFGNVYGSQPLWLAIRVDDDVDLPRQRLTAAPLAIHSESAASGPFWRLGGNAGTNPATDYLGTTDSTAFELRTHGDRHFRIEPSVLMSEGLPVTANLIAGSSANTVSPGVRGAFIGGGGELLDDPSDDEGNLVSGHYGIVVGGVNNRVNDTTSVDPGFRTLGVIVGGSDNAATGSHSVVVGGSGNIAGKSHSVVVGGLSINNEEQESFMGGGFDNEILSPGRGGVVVGGHRHELSGRYATIPGGHGNHADGDYSFAVGQSSAASGSHSSVGGGLSNSADGDNSTVGGGSGNFASGLDATVPGGFENEANGAKSFAAGNRAHAEHDGAFVWADSVDEDFSSSGTNQFLIRAAGGVGVNEDSPLAALHVESEIGEDPLRVRVNGVTSLRAAENRGVSIGTLLDAPNEGLRVSGLVELESIDAAGGSELCLNSNIVSDCNASSRELKKDIESLELAGELIERLRAVRFNWKATGEADIGLIAEEVAEVEPDLVTFHDDGEVRGVKYRQLSVVLIGAMQDQQAEIESWRQEALDRLAALESENARLQLAMEKNAEMAERNRELEQRLAALEAVLLEDEQVARRSSE